MKCQVVDCDMGQTPEIPERPTGYHEEMSKRIAGDEPEMIGNKWKWGMWRPTDNIHYVGEIGSIWKSQSGSCHDSLIL